jgi:hypothetical protein
MVLVLSQKLYRMEYNDIVGEQYHYPRRYWSYVKPGEIFVYYHPSEKQDPKRYYFGVGRIGAVQPDSSQSDHRYAEIIDYAAFPRPVPFKENGEYLEARQNAGTQFFRAVRLISKGVFNKILDRAEDLESDVILQFSKETATKESDQILADLNRQYKNLEPKLYKRLTAQIDRPTSISKALKKKLGYTCQICGIEGFEKKSGGRYAEAHHLLELHKLLPGSLITENILIVCANCHRKLHYADVEVNVLTPTTLEITINGTSYHVQRNV